MNRVRLPNRRKHFRGAGAVDQLPWDDTYETGDMTLSAAGYTATRTGTNNATRAMRGVTGNSSGLLQGEVTVFDSSLQLRNQFGIALSTWDVNSVLGSANDDSADLESADTTRVFKEFKGVSTLDGTAGGYTDPVNNVGQVWLNMTTGKVWFGIDDTVLGGGDPVAGTGATFTDVIFQSGTWHLAFVGRFVPQGVTISKTLIHPLRAGYTPWG